MNEPTRLKLEKEFHKWAKETGARVDVFNVLGWLDDRGLLASDAGLLLSDRQRELLTEVRDVLLKAGWVTTASKVDEVLKEV